MCGTKTKGSEKRVDAVHAYIYTMENPQQGNELHRTVNSQSRPVHRFHDTTVIPHSEKNSRTSRCLHNSLPLLTITLASRHQIWGHQIKSLEYIYIAQTITFYRTGFHLYDWKTLNVSRIIFRVSEFAHPSQSDICRVQHVVVMNPLPADESINHSPESGFAITRMVYGYSHRSQWHKPYSVGFHSAYLIIMSAITLDYTDWARLTTINGPHHEARLNRVRPKRR